MDMIFDAADGEGLHAVLASYAAHIGPQARFQFWRDYFLAVFGAKDVMHVEANV